VNNLFPLKKRFTQLLLVACLLASQAIAAAHSEKHLWSKDSANCAICVLAEHQGHGVLPDFDTLATLPSYSTSIPFKLAPKPQRFILSTPPARGPPLF